MLKQPATTKWVCSFITQDAVVCACVCDCRSDTLTSDSVNDGFVIAHMHSDTGWSKFTGCYDDDDAV